MMDNIKDTLSLSRDGPTAEDINELSCDVDFIDTVEDFDDDDYIETSRDHVKAYLRSIGKFKVLPPEQELSLAKKVREEHDEQARQTLINSNLRFVVHVAKRYYKYFYTTSLDILDIIQDGNAGLMIAVDRYDYTTGWRFLTYAYWWIRQTILRGVQNAGSNIRIPVHACEQMRYIQKAREVLSIAETDNEEDLQKLCDFINSHPKYLANKNLLTINKIKEYDMIRRTTRTVSLNTPVDDSDSIQDTTLGDFIEDDPETRPANVVERTMLEEYLNNIVDKVLDARIALVVRLRFGVGTFGRPPMTLTDAGCVLGITRERVRQLEAKGINTLQFYFKKLGEKHNINYEELMRG